MGSGNEVCSNGPGHMTSMTKQPMTLEVGMQHRVLEYYQVVHMMTLG